MGPVLTPKMTSTDSAAPLPAKNFKKPSLESSHASVGNNR